MDMFSNLDKFNTFEEFLDKEKNLQELMSKE